MCCVHPVSSERSFTPALSRPKPSRQVFSLRLLRVQCGEDRISIREGTSRVQSSWSFAYICNERNAECTTHLLAVAVAGLSRGRHLPAIGGPLCGSPTPGGRRRTAGGFGPVATRKTQEKHLEMVSIQRHFTSGHFYLSRLFQSSLTKIDMKIEWNYSRAAIELVS